MDVKTLVFAILGGTLIALATTLHLLFYGRVTGMSSVFNTLVKCDTHNGFKWKFGLFAGLITGTYGVFMVFGPVLNIANLQIQLFDTTEEAQGGLSTLGFALGGLLVGFGTKLGNGCTSGHGVCGLPRLSLRSWVAVPTFMLTGVLTATLRASHPFFTSSLNVGKEAADQYKTIADFLFTLLIIYFAYDLNVNSARGMEKVETLLLFGIGIIFGLGLALSGMCRRTRILSFLSLNGIDSSHKFWNPSLCFVMFTAVVINLMTFNIIIQKKPIFTEKFDFASGKIDWKVIVGPAIFGVGWGLTGLCPGPAMVNGFLIMQMLAYLPFMAAGQLIADWLFPKPKQIPQLSPEISETNDLKEKSK